jgi:hypothetical protein
VKRQLTLKIITCSLFAVFCFIACQLFVSHITIVKTDAKRELKCSINSNSHTEFPSNDGHSKVTISSRHLLLNAPLNIAQDVFLIFEIYYTRESIGEHVKTAPIPLNKFLDIVLKEIISPNAP